MPGVIATIPKFQFSSNGVPMVNGTVDTYLAGTTTPETTWQDQAQTTANTNPIVLDSRGEALVWLDPAKSYKFVLKNSGGVIQWTVDNIGGNRSSADLANTTDLAKGISLVGGGARQVDAITAVNATGLPDGSVIIAKGRSTAGDGGGGIFRYVAGSAQATDGGTVFAPTAGGGRLFRDSWTAFGFNEPLNVRWFGAKGDNATNDVSAIQAANDALGTNGGVLFFPNGTYKIGAPVNLTPRVSLQGEGGHLASRIVGTHAGNLFQYVAIDHCEISGLAFDGAGCTAFRQTGVGTNYTQNVVWRDCHFYGQLFECIYGNLILCKVENNTFGYYGTVGASHRHIVSLASATNLTNANLVSRNRFFFAKGNESIRFDSGEGLMLWGNNWEQNTALPVRLNGLFNAKVLDNYFEANTLTTAEIEINAGTHVIDSQPTDIRGNEFHPSAGITNLVQINNSLSEIAFDFNTGAGMAGKTISNNASKVISQRGNTFGGLTTDDYIALPHVKFPATQIASTDQNTLDDYEEGTFTLTDASGAGLTLVDGAGTYTKIGNRVSFSAAFSYPATANGANAKLGGLPFNAAAITPVISLDNSGVGITFGIDAAAATMVPYQDGTLTARTNAQLSGKQFYVAGQYSV